MLVSPQTEEVSACTHSAPNKKRFINSPFHSRRSTQPWKKTSSEQKHAVFLRDQGKCTHVGHNKKRCGDDRWTQIHHIIHVNQGGTNDLENLTTLCSFHHDLVHQLSLPLEGQVSWLRSPRTPYKVKSTNNHFFDWIRPNLRPTAWRLIVQPMPKLFGGKRRSSSGFHIFLRGCWPS